MKKDQLTSMENFCKYKNYICVVSSLEEDDIDVYIQSGINVIDDIISLLQDTEFLQNFDTTQFENEDFDFKKFYNDVVDNYKIEYDYNDDDFNLFNHLQENRGCRYYEI